jgi:hypothetical protein
MMNFAATVLNKMNDMKQRVRPIVLVRFHAGSKIDCVVVEAVVVVLVEP